MLGSNERVRDGAGRVLGLGDQHRQQAARCEKLLEENFTVRRWRTQKRPNAGVPQREDQARSYGLGVFLNADSDFRLIRAERHETGLEHHLYLNMDLL